MSSKKDHLVKISAKSDLAGTGVDEGLARQMCSHKGKTYMAVVEVVVDTIHDKLSGQLVADLSITQFWPATETELHDHLRELTLVLHQNKALASTDDDPIDGIDGPAPRVKDVLAAGERHLPHEFISGSLSTDDNPVCDICGQLADTDLHQTQEEDLDDDQPDDDELDDDAAELTDDDEPRENDQPEPTTIPDPFATATT